ncbi:3-methyl-2-oxobutanoate hydroxymethyltransferase [Longimicrobium sp.]|uniref:3-methyl-2-oxobutanoate hydroxymethyltransferase n=1 Tax=Longimicrobium sp. TaxID=2029185 RepID=UPI002D8057A6|nr:3-methyl-2-oxobutanoate hydroxymethyltransferase [Longimicrobium sp.]
MPDLREMKRRGDKIAALTAYDYLFARLVDGAGVDVVLVGDSLGQVILGLDTTLPVTLDDMIHHARAVRRGVERALLVVDLPFLTYQVSREDAVRNAGRVLQETYAHAVKLEGGSERTAETIRAMVEAGIPVMGHLGFTPQSVNVIGVKVQGRDDGNRRRLIDEARRVEDAGAFAIVLELMPGELAEEITAALEVPTIGIGAGAGCDGQVLVLHDMLGLNTDFRPKFLRRFAEVGQAVSEGVGAYVRAVKGGEYPGAEHTFE